MTERDSIRMEDRLLAEAVRAAEGDGAALIDEPAADAEARDHGGGLEERIVVRAAALDIAAALREAVDSVRYVIVAMITCAVVLALLAGAGAVRAALGAEDGDPVNVYLLLSGVLGIQTLLLLLWFLLMVVRPRSAQVSPLGSAAYAAGRWLARRLHHGPVQVAAVRAVTATNAHGPIARWTFSGISHGLWFGFNIGALTMLIVLLSTRHYRFNWETTILSGDAYVSITRGLARAPEAIGFLAPTEAQIVASEGAVDRAAADEARGAWSGFLAGAVVVYGLAPRLVLVLVALLARARANRRFRLDLTAPGYVRLRARLMPDSEGRGIVGDGNAPAPAEARKARTPPGAESAGTGPPVLLGLEIEAPAGTWPPPLHAVRWEDLGFVDGREDRQRVEHDLLALPEPPRIIVLVCALTSTPDRGLGAFVARVREIAPGPVAVVLTAGHALRERAGAAQVEQRVADWRALATAAGISAERVLEIDLDHLTDTSQRRLADLVGALPPKAAAADRLRTAFELVAKAAGTRPAHPTAGEQASLCGRVADLYRAEARSWQQRLGLPAKIDGDPLPQLRSGAERFLTLLPDRLKRSPRWLAAGAITGALGCAAAAALISPVAIGALPIWSGLGAAVAAAFMPGGGGKGTAGPEEDDAGHERGDALRAATMLALLLEMQGYEEASISRVLEATLAEASTSVAATADERVCAAWLDEVRHRFDMALAAETNR